MDFFKVTGITSLAAMHCLSPTLRLTIAMTIGCGHIYALTIVKEKSWKVMEN